MRWGFDSLGPGALACAVLAPLALILLINSGTSAYCQRQEDLMTSRRCMLASLPEMTNACATAGQTLALFHRCAPGAPGGPEELGRWLRSSAIRNGAELQTLAVGSVSGADPCLPTLRATFRTEQHSDMLLPLMRDLEQAPWLVTCESIRLRKTEPPLSGHYVAEVVLQASELSLPAGGESEKGAGP